jgi:hypothetical protein
MKVVNKKIEMVAQFNKDGLLRPIRFRISENDTEKVIPIKLLKYATDEKIEGIRYRRFVCMVEIEEIQKLCEVTFRPDTMEWRLYKI